MKKFDLTVTETKKKGTARRKKCDKEIIGEDYYVTEENDNKGLVEGEYKLRPNEKIVQVFKFD